MRIPLPRIDDPVPNAPFPTPGQGLVLGLTGSLDPSVKVPGSSLVAPVAGSLLAGSVQGSLLTGTVAGSLLTGSVAGSLLTGTVAGSLLTGTVASSLLTGALPAAIQQTLPGYEYAYTEITAPVTSTQTVEGSATTVVTASAVTFDGSTTAIITFSSPDVANSGAFVTYILLYDGSTIVGYLGQTTPQVGVAFRGEKRITPSAGAHTYSVRMIVSAGTGTVSAGTGGTGGFVPAFIRITRV